MAFQAKAALPGLTAEQARAIIEQFRAVSAELTALGIPAETVSELIAADRVAEIGELIRCCPPAADMGILLPPATEQNKGDSIRLAVESVLSGGQVNVAVVGGQLMNGAATVAITTVGMNEFTSLGPSGWSFLAGGGGGETLAATLLLGNTTGGTDVNFTGGSELQMAGDPGTLGEVLTSQGPGVSPIWAAVGGGSAAMTDVTVTLSFTGAHSGTANVVDAAIGAASNVGIFWGDVLDTDANSPEMDAVTFTCIPAAGSMTVRVSSDKAPVGGAYKIRYLIG